MNESKVTTLAQIEGFDSIDDLLEAYIVDSVCPGICSNPDCDYTIEVEPDCRDGYCEECGTQTVQSAMILMKII